MLEWRRMVALRRRGGDARPERVRIHPDVLSATHDGVTVLLDLKREVFFSLDEVGAHIWHGVESGSTRTEIVSSLGAEYEADTTLLAADADRFLGDLLERRLVVPA